MRFTARYLAPALLVLVLLGSASCSFLWDEVSSYIEDDDANDSALRQSDDNKDFPKLGDVPDTPRTASSPEDLDRLSEGLVADRDEARYTNETLRSRYAEVAGEDTGRQIAAPSSAPVKVARADELADGRRLSATQSATGGLAEERRVGGVEPASEAVLRERRAARPGEPPISGGREASAYAAPGDGPDGGTLADSRQIGSEKAARKAISGDARPPRERRLAASNTAAAAGVMSISQFRALFNERFDSSGRSPYLGGGTPEQAAPVAEGSLATERALSPGGETIVQAQLELAPPEPAVAETLGASGQAEVSFQATSIPFAVGSSALNSSDRTALKRIVKLHKQFGGVVRVIGHSSQRTRDMAAGDHNWVNFQLSLDRATAVSMELTRLGVPAEAVRVVARSDAEPLSYEYMPQGEAENRRADVYIEY